MEDINVSELSLSEAETLLEELKARAMEETDETARAEIEKQIRLVQDQLTILNEKAYQAMREAAGLPPVGTEAPVN